MKLSLIAVAAVAALSVAGCSDDDKAPPATTDTGVAATDTGSPAETGGGDTGTSSETGETGGGDTGTATEAGSDAPADGG